MFKEKKVVAKIERALDATCDKITASEYNDRKERERERIIKQTRTKRD